MKKISSPWHYLIISSKLTNLSTSSDPRSNCIYVLFVIHCVPIRLYFKFLANHQITWFFFFIYCTYLRKKLFSSSFLIFLGTKSQTVKRLFIVILYIHVFRCRWHQLMCYKYCILSPCVLILGKLSVEKPDKLKILTPFKSMVFVSVVSLKKIVFVWYS